MAETMKRIWNESRSENATDGNEAVRFNAEILADRGVTQNHATVLRIEKTIQHWHWNDDEPCEDHTCRFGREYHEVIADPVRHSEQESIRIAIRHADALFEHFAEDVTEARLVLKPPPPEEAPRG
jgi:hypothetical protein